MILQDPEKDPVNMTRITAIYDPGQDPVTVMLSQNFLQDPVKDFYQENKPVCGFLIVNFQRPSTRFKDVIANTNPSVSLHWNCLLIPGKINYDIYAARHLNVICLRVIKLTSTNSTERKTIYDINTAHI